MLGVYKKEAADMNYGDQGVFDPTLQAAKDQYMRILKFLLKHFTTQVF